MKKILIFAFLALVMSVTALASEEILIGTPDIDGIVDSMYLDSYKIELDGGSDIFYPNKSASGSEGDSATAYYLYDEGHLYVCIDVNDNALYSRGRAWVVKYIDRLSWENDAVEARVYYPELGEAIQANQYIFQCDAKGIASTNYLGMCEEKYSVSTALTNDGYTVEFCLPLSFGKKAGDTVGLSVEIDDLNEKLVGADQPLGGHSFTAYGSQHPYENMVRLSENKAKTHTTVYDDTKNHWGKGYISYVLKAELFNGMGMGFQPDVSMTRAMFVTVLGRIYEKKNGSLPEVNSTVKFSDVDYEAWYGKYVEWASYQSIVNGYTDGTFKPDGSVTRQEMAVMLHRFSKDVHDNELLTFADSTEIDSWARNAVSYCASMGYLTGNEENKFVPKNNATRAEVSALMARYMTSLTVKIY